MYNFYMYGGIIWPKLSKKEKQFEKQLFKASQAIHSGDINKAKILIPIIDAQFIKTFR